MPHAEDVVARAVDELSTDGIQLETSKQIGEPGAIIVETARRIGASIIAMATDRFSAADRALNGSVMDWVLRHTHVPVLVIKPACQFDAWGSAQIQTILVPLDGSPLAEEALSPAVQVAHLLGAELILVRAIRREDPSEVAQTNSYLENFTGRLDGVYARSMTPAVAASADRAVLDTAETVAASLIVMATHGRSGLERVLFGSVAARIIEQATVPVLLVRPASVDSPSEPGVLEVAH